MAGAQRAAFVKEIGKPVELGSREIPSPKEGEVLVKVTATMREFNYYVQIFIQTRIESNNHSPSSRHLRSRLGFIHWPEASCDPWFQRHGSR